MQNYQLHVSHAKNSHKNCSDNSVPRAIVSYDRVIKWAGKKIEPCHEMKQAFDIHLNINALDLISFLQNSPINEGVNHENGSDSTSYSFLIFGNLSQKLSETASVPPGD